MPELPEVESIRRVLHARLTGRTVRKVRLINAEAAAYPDAEEFCRGLVGRRVLGTHRRGKFLSLELEGGTLTFHLRMTGCLLPVESGFCPLKHTHIIIAFDEGELHFSDPRRFGRAWFIREGEPDVSGAERLGPEPFDEAFTGEYLKGRVGGSSRAIKTCLMDQSVVAGIGNIYSDEILFSAGVDPARRARDIGADEYERIAALTPQRLRFFTEKNEISYEDYIAGLGKDYRNTPYLQVYGRAGLPCEACGGALVRRVIGGRGSVYCPHCQK